MTNITDFTARRQFRGLITTPPRITTWPFTPEELRKAASALERYERHTSEMPPVHVENEALAFEIGWRRAKYAGIFLLGLAFGIMFGYWVLPRLVGVVP